MKYKIYKLVYNNQVIYVGSTTLKRLSQRKAIGYPKIPKDIWKSSSIQLIQESDDKQLEDFWIDYFRNCGCSLYNKQRAVYDDSYQRDYYIKNKDLKIKKVLDYYYNNKQKVLDYKKDYRNKKKDL
jgi:hypothetical protein